MGKKNQIYVVVNGRQPGVYPKWFGEDGARDQTEGFSDAIYKGFRTYEEAVQWLKGFPEETLVTYAPHLLDLIGVEVELKKASTLSMSVEELLEAGKVVIHTDGGADPNPGAGGYGVVLRYRNHRKELSGGYRLTTNNRMELLACIAALKALKYECEVVLFSDSRYVVDGIMKGWARNWQANGWKRSKKVSAENADLWAQLLELCSQHTVSFRWVKGHDGNVENERCDKLASQAAKATDLAVDEVYEVNKG